MADWLGVKEDDLYVEFFGLNHLSWIRSVKRKGEEILPKLLADDSFLAGIQEFAMFDPKLLRLMGLLPMNICIITITERKRLPIYRKQVRPEGKP